MEESKTIEGFHGVYLLYCMNTRYKGRTYIGYTVDPNRRIKQHNRGCHFGGARRTSSKGPWEMVLTVYGFPSDVAALRFEWAWQHPLRSRRLKNCISKKTSKEKAYDYALRIMWTMLRLPPWCRLPLTLRWLFPELVKNPLPGLIPPPHIAIEHGLVSSKKLSPIAIEDPTGEQKCSLCHKVIELEERLICVHPECNTCFHIVCLASCFLNQLSHCGKEYLLPVEGVCPKCNASVLWGDLIRKRKGCSDNFVVE